MKTLLEDYERRLKTVLIELKNCPLDIEKETRLATKASCYRTFISEIKKQLTLTDVSQQRELLPEFLMHDLDGKIITSVIGSADVTKEWNEYLGN